MDTEDKMGDADVPVAYMPNLNAVTLLQMDGQLSPKEFDETVKMAIKGCKKIYDIQTEALKTKYKIIEQEEVEE